MKKIVLLSMLSLSALIAKSEYSALTSSYVAEYPSAQTKTIEEQKPQVEEELPAEVKSLKVIPFSTKQEYQSVAKNYTKLGVIKKSREIQEKNLQDYAPAGSLFVLSRSYYSNGTQYHDYIFFK